MAPKKNKLEESLLESKNNELVETKPKPKGRTKKSELVEPDEPVEPVEPDEPVEPVEPESKPKPKGRTKKEKPEPKPEPESEPESEPEPKSKPKNKTKSKEDINDCVVEKPTKGGKKISKTDNSEKDELKNQQWTNLHKEWAIFEAKINESNKVTQELEKKRDELLKEMAHFSNNNDENIVAKITELKKERNSVLKDIETTLTKQKETSKKNKIITKVINIPKLEDSNDDSDTSEEDSDDEVDKDDEDEEKVSSKKKIVNKFTANSSNKKKINNDSD